MKATWTSNNFHPTLWRRFEQFQRKCILDIFSRLGSADTRLVLLHNGCVNTRRTKSNLCATSTKVSNKWSECQLYCFTERWIVPQTTHISGRRTQITINLNVLGFQTTTVGTLSAIFWDAKPCNLIEVKRFKGTYCLHLQGRKVSQSRDMFFYCV
jgi:hypothetical protein